MTLRWQQSILKTAVEQFSLTSSKVSMEQNLTKQILLSFFVVCNTVDLLNYSFEMQTFFW